jgi:hypothetical protein
MMVENRTISGDELDRAIIDHYDKIQRGRKDNLSTDGDINGIDCYNG